MLIKHHCVHDNGKEEAFDVDVSKYTFEDGDRFSLKIRMHPSLCNNSGVPAEVIELVLSPRQMAKLHVETEPWQ
jgi:hypothetical protein